jgi:DNA (cytosine-5)-methyltransferase 1
MAGTCHCGARAHFGYGPPLVAEQAWYSLKHRPDGGAPIVEAPIRRAAGVFYNDNVTAAWLRELVRASLLPKGEVSGRSVLNLNPADVAGFRHCHFFCGIGGWPYALALAGWPDDREIWTASLPCQPFSSAGQHLGNLDERHLWPAFYRLVAARRPATIVGEQVASKDGREWLAGVRLDLEGAGYACGAANLPACAVGSPQQRERLFWFAIDPVAHAEEERRRRRPDDEDGGRGQQPFADRDARGGFWDDAIVFNGADGKARRVGKNQSGVCRLAHGLPIELDRLWDDGFGAIPLLARDVPGWTGLIHGLGNAIVPQIGAEFVRAFMDVMAETAP